MPGNFSRRNFFQVAAGAGVLAGTPGRQSLLLAREIAAGAGPSGLPEPVIPVPGRARVALVQGASRRGNITQALAAIDDQILPVLKQKKYVVLKPNIVNAFNQLASTHVDALLGIYDYLAPRFKGPIVVAESSAGDTSAGYSNLKYGLLSKQDPGRKVEMVDLNAEAKYQMIHLLSPDLHVQPVRLAARLLDPDAFVICCGILKTHNTVVATLSIKNMTLGAPLHAAPKEKPFWNDKRKYHDGIRQTHYNMMLTAQKLAPFWGATVLDGWEGMEGDGPGSGTPVEQKIAIASRDYVAADRVACECMSIDPLWLAYLQYCWQVGLGQLDPAKIDVVGAKIADVKCKYLMHPDIDRELQWRGPLEEIPPKMG